MQLLVVEGNPQKIWTERQQSGGVPYHKRFQKMLWDMGYRHIDIAFPVEKQGLPDKNSIKKYQGILLTGSSLNVYGNTPEVTNQLDFASHCFDSGIPIYGSCWGLQIAVTVAGGKIRKGKNGREFGVAKDITLTEAGKQCPFYQGKPTVFDALCIHEDDTHELPDNTQILASNAHSEVQALSLYYKQSAFFGVQYHPEFIYEDIGFLANFMEKRLIDEAIFTTEKDKHHCLTSVKQHPSVNDIDFSTSEIRQWLQNLER